MANMESIEDSNGGEEAAEDNIDVGQAAGEHSIAQGSSISGRKEFEQTAGMDANNQQLAVTRDPELVVKHPLENKWALWYFKNDGTKKDWNEYQHFVATFEFVEDFWALYHHIQPASKLVNGRDYSVFKDGIRPAWEDERNKKGGRWTFKLEQNQRSEKLDTLWLEILLCLIGEAFGEYSEEVCGAVVNIRKGVDKVGVWTTNAGNGVGARQIGKTLKERLNIPSNVFIPYQLHKDLQSRTGSYSRITYTV